jgi:hypothetical protein
MPPATVQVECPRFPEHGMASKRWLTQDEREMFTKDDGNDVFEIDCKICGKYEYCGDHGPLIS